MDNLPKDVLVEIRNKLNPRDRRALRNINSNLNGLFKVYYPVEKLREEDIQYHLEFFYSYKPEISTVNQYVNIKFTVPIDTLPTEPLVVNIRIAFHANKTELLLTSEYTQQDRERKLQIELITLTMYYVISLYPTVIDLPLSLYFQIDEPYPQSLTFLDIDLEYTLLRINWSKAKYFIAYDNVEYILDVLEFTSFDFNSLINIISGDTVSAPIIPRYARQSMNIAEKENILTTLIKKLDYFQFSHSEGTIEDIIIQGSIQNYKFKMEKSTRPSGRYLLNFFQEDEELVYTGNVLFNRNGPLQDNTVDEESLQSFLLPIDLDVGLVVYTCLLLIDVLNTKNESGKRIHEIEVVLFMFSEPISFEITNLGKLYYAIEMSIYDLSNFFESYSIQAVNNLFRKRISLFEFFQAIRLDHYPEIDYIID